MLEIEFPNSCWPLEQIYLVVPFILTSQASPVLRASLKKPTLAPLIAKQGAQNLFN